LSYIFHILAALFTLGLPQLGWAGTAELPWLVPLPCLLPYGLAWYAHRRAVNGGFRVAAGLERMAGLSPLLGQVLAVAGFGWTESIELWWGTEVNLTQWPGLGLLLGILPFVVFQLCAIDARVRLNEPRTDRRRELRSLQLRLFFSALIPFTVFLLASILITLHRPLQILFEEVALYNTAYVAAMIAVFVAIIPRLLEKTWETAPLEPGPLRDVFDGVARAARFRCRELLVWKTGHHMVNAAVIGFTARSRVVLFTDALLAQLGPRQLAAVFAHEIGHARGRHPAVFGAFALLLFFGSDLLLEVLPLEGEAAAIGVFLALFALWLLAFGYASRRFELEADLASVELLGDERPLIEALEEVGGNVRRHKASWRHFGMEQRIRFLGRASRDPAVGRRLRRTLRAWKIAGLVLLLAVLGLEGRKLVGSLGADRVHADLRLGRYEAAASRIAAGTEVEEIIARLVERGKALGEEERSPEALEAAARAALESGEIRSCSELLHLVILRGRKGLLEVLDAVDALAEVEDGKNLRPLTEDELSSLPESWRPLLRAPRFEKVP